MRKHNGMRPQDVAILLKIISIDGKDWQMARLSHLLGISASEISEFLNRNQLANLIDYHKKNVNKQNFFEFLEHGVSYVFPQQPVAMVRGLPTAHSHPSMKEIFSSDINYVWSDNKGTIMGLVIEPFYPERR